MSYIIDKCKLLKNVELQLSQTLTIDKNLALQEVAEALDRNREEILEGNRLDIKNAVGNNIAESLVDRLRLDNSRIDGIIDGIETVIQLQDPVWKSDRVWTMENGMTISKMTVPLGVMGIVYESRPNVTVDAFSLALKSGNCIILRGSSSAINSNIALVKSIKEGLAKSNVSPDVVQFIEDTDREYVLEMLKAKDYIDLIIPRGGRNLIDFVVENASVPTLQTGEGNCHVFVDETADMNKAISIVKNSKAHRVGVCNACETLLVHEAIAAEFLPKIYEELKDSIEFRGCDKSVSIIPINKATDSDWSEEYLDYILAVKIVEDIDEAIYHISKYGSMHSEGIVTESYTNSNKFTRSIDASTVYVNVSTRFTDGAEFGFGAEMGISTQKTHARGPVGLEQLVTSKYIVLGEGQIRK